MNHHPYYRNRPGANSAVLLIHGILSTPRHFDWIIPHIPEEYEIRNILLAGHGGTVKDFSKANMTQWKTQVENELVDLEKHFSNVYMICHSLGTLLALQEVKSHACIRGLILLNIPLKPFLSFSIIGRSIRFAFGKIRANDPMDLRCYNDLGVTLHPYLWKYICWIPNFLSLIKLARKCRPLPATLNIPCYAYFCKNDEVVRPRSAKYLKNNPNITVTLLESGTHFYYPSDEKSKILHGLDIILNNMNNKSS